MKFRMELGERRQIQELLDHGTEIKDIAKAIKRSNSTISSEIKKNGGIRLYNAQKAQDKSDQIKKESNEGKNAPLQHLRMRVELLESFVLLNFSHLLQAQCNQVVGNEPD